MLRPSAVLRMSIACVTTASCALALTLWATPARSQADSTGAASDTTFESPPPAAPDTTVESRSGVASDSLVARLLEAGLENLTVSADGHVVAYENRRYRHSATALGLVAGAAQGPVTAIERRLGLASMAVEIPGDTTFPSHVLHPTSAFFPPVPAGGKVASTHRKLDLVVGPLLTYELPRILTPALVRWEIQGELRANPWPGGRLRGALVVPLENQLGRSPENPDVDNIRPGPVLLEQYGWSKGTALMSATAGLLGNNRYGMSLGLARPLMSGEILLDGQADVTGFIAFNDSGSTFSTPDRWSGFVGVTYRPPRLDLGIRLRAAKFLRGDDGIELEVRRAMGDFDIAFFTQKIRGLRVLQDDGSFEEPLIGGVRIVLPVPPITRPVSPRVRVLPIERFTFTYNEESLPAGQYLANVASREEFMRQLDRSSLSSNEYRYRQARLGDRTRAKAPPQWVSMVGTTGFVNTPWAGVMGDREIEFGFNQYPKEVAYYGRAGTVSNTSQEFPNEVYYAAMGFLPRMEVGLRWTVVPGLHPFTDLLPESPAVYADRMLSGRIEVIRARPGRLPGLAIGVDDARGTRRFHSTYAVTGLPFDIYHLQNRVTLGYAPRAFKASRWALDGAFGAVEVTALRSVAVALEHDTEKWNTMLGINLGFGLRARAALLDLEHLGIGVGWHTAL